MATETAPNKLLGKKELMSVFWRQFFLQAAWNYERMQALGYCYIVLPVLKKLYQDRPEQLKKALTRNLEFFNTQPYMAAPILGVAVAMEEQMAMGEEVEPESISSLKVGMMGPFAGIGDSLFWLTFRPIAMAIGIAIASQGSILGPIIALTLFNITHVYTRYAGFMRSYDAGIAFLAQIRGTSFLQRLTESAGVLSCMVLGTMTATMVTVNTKLIVPVGQAKLNIQQILDAIMPNLLPLLTVYVCFRLLKKGWKPTNVLYSILLVGLLGALVGFFQ